MGDREIMEHGDGSEADVRAPTGQESVDRIASVFFVSGAILLFLSAFLVTVQGVENLLQRHFERVVAESIDIPATARPPGDVIREKLAESVENSAWVRIWGVKVSAAVRARDGRGWLYVNGGSHERPYQTRDPNEMVKLHARLLPATAVVTTTVDHKAALFLTILAAYAGLFLAGFVVHNRSVVDRHAQAIDDARESRDQVAKTAARIESELAAVRAQLQEVVPAAEHDRDEIARLQSEQQELRARLETLAARERSLRGQADRVAVLEEDSRVLEEMLEEATENLNAKEAEIRELASSLKRSDKAGGGAARSLKARELLAKRLNTFYPQIDIDDRALDDMVALPDETTRLRAEECIKRLAEEADNLSIRRKVKALRNNLPIYEIGFAGKRRLYYARLKEGRFRILVVGDKNTQRSDLDYLEKFPKGKFV